ncbi:negative regulator of systemic acquired resistance SNI1 isoform X4 [Aristolochia californica]|uniref:negative regulator of systemic acquired resistance SNI1 isoform X4 n=1 Tax=Aristolochia californica TaxID=171875 RepID=UPI0035DB687B
MESRRRSMRGLEENTMAILDTCGVKDSRDVHDDRLSFLEAVRSASIIATDGTVPTRKMFDAIFEIFKDGMSLELTVASYRLLCDLDKHYPRVYFSQSDEIVVVQEAWSPFAFGSGNTREAINCRPSVELIDSDRFFLLTQKIAQTVSEMDPLNFGMEDIGNMFLFQYIVNVLAQDFVPLSASYRSKLKEELVPIERVLTPSASVPELQKEVCVSVQRLLTVIMELDVIKMEADREGVTSRVDGVRTPLVELILEELMYNKDLLCPFLEVFSEPKWKLKIILQYFSKYCKVASVRTRRSNNIVEAATLENVLKLFSNETKARQIVKKVNADAAQLLLSQAFHAYMSLKQGVDTSSTLDEEIGGSSIVQICRDMISAFQNLRRTTKDLEIELFQKEALFTAATILLRES